MIDYFSTAMSFNWHPDNDGEGPHNDTNDPGGWTSWGVTFSEWLDWERKHGNYTASLDDFKKVLKETFLPLYRADYWNACRCGNMGPFGIAIFDAAVLSGPGNAAKLLQKAVAATVDGEIGPITIARFNQEDPNIVNEKFYQSRINFHNSCNNAPRYAGGWNRRAYDCKILVQSILKPVTKQIIK